MVAFLKKLQGSEDVHQIVDFLNGHSISYALTENPIIYVSPINQFWRTASTKTLNNGEIEINATVDGQDKTITEASARRHLKLADADDSRLNTSHKRLYIAPALTHKVFSNMKRESMGFSMVETSLFPIMLVNEQLSLGEGPTSAVGTQHTPTVIETKAVKLASLHARPERLSNLPNEPPLDEGNTSRSGTKAVHNKALITLTKRVKKLEKNLKLKRRSAVVDSSKDEKSTLHNEDSSKRGRMIEEIDEDENVDLVKRSKQGEAHDTVGHRMESDDTKVVDFSTASPQNDDDEVTLAETLVNIKMSATKDKVEEEIVRQDDVVSEQVVKESSRKADGRLKRKTSKARKDKDKRQKNQDDQEKLTLMEYVEVISDSEEVISVISLAVKSSIVSWKSYCKEDVGYYEIHRADGSYKTYIFFSEMLNDFDREDLTVLYRLFNEKYASTRPGEVSIHMLVEKKYPLPQDTLMRILHVNYNVTEMAYELLRFIRSQLNQ
ncbi:hypothetical protein Tco_0576789 [Tanacetum coccineum]